METSESNVKTYQSGSCRIVKFVLINRKFQKLVKFQKLHKFFQLPNSTISTNSTRSQPLRRSRSSTIRKVSKNAGRETRTPDLSITNRLLYHLSHPGIIKFQKSKITKFLKSKKSKFQNRFFGQEEIN